MFLFIFEFFSQIPTIGLLYFIGLFFLAMLTNIYLFTGQETYLLDKELHRRRENFLNKFGPDSIFQFSLDNLDIWQIKQSIYSSGLFTTKKLILINGLPLDALTKLGEDKNNELTHFVEAFIKAEWKIPDDSLLVFISSTPDKRLRLYKFLEKNANIKEFNQMRTNDLEGFVKEELKAFTIDHPTIHYLLTKVGSDLYRVWSECDKLRTWATVKDKKTIDEAMIDYIVFGQVETDSFLLLKALFTDQRKAMHILEKIQEWGADRNQFVGMLYRATKFNIFMIDLDESGVKDSKTIAGFLKMNPWQVKNAYAEIWALKVNKKNIETFYSHLIELNAAIQTGKYPDTYFWLGVKKLINQIV